MPQLNKGGKFVFGISVIRPDLTILFPPQARLEYGLARENRVILFTGSRSTGGFCVTTRTLLRGSKLRHILEACPELDACRCRPGAFVPYKGRQYAWLQLEVDGRICLPQSALALLSLRPGDELLSIRSSNIAFTMGAKGRLLERAAAFAGEIDRY